MFGNTRTRSKHSQKNRKISHSLIDKEPTRNKQINAPIIPCESFILNSTLMSLFKNYQQLKLSTIFLAQSFNILFFYVQVFSIYFFLQKFENKHFFSKIV